MKSLLVCLLFIFSLQIFAQQKITKADPLLIGTWKGTSICQVKPSPCHGEIAIYHITKADKPNMYRIVMNKEVNKK